MFEFDISLSDYEQKIESIYLSYANDNIWPSAPFRQV